MLVRQIDFHIAAAVIISLVGSGAPRILGLSGHCLRILDVGDQGIVLCLLIDLPAVRSAGDLHRVSAACDNGPVLSVCVIFICKLLDISPHCILVKGHIHAVVNRHPLRDDRRIHHFRVRTEVVGNAGSQITVHGISCCRHFRRISSECRQHITSFRLHVQGGLKSADRFIDGFRELLCVDL